MTKITPLCRRFTTADLSVLTRRQGTRTAAWRMRLRAFRNGYHWPDPRDDELRDRGVELLWRARVQANEQRRQSE